MDGDDDWDLYAVVRGCRSLATRDPLSSFAARPEPMAAPEILCAEIASKDSSFTEHSDPFWEFDSSFRELEELCRPFYIQSSQQQHLLQSAQSKIPSPSPPSSSVAAGIVELLPQQQPVAVHRPTQRVLAAGPITRSKRRKNQQKKVVCQVPVDGLSSDMWAWRKYGQKPIKGSPYPRGYYRCSSSKSCLARKQVERSRTDPKLFIVTYTSEHNHPMPAHRNSLAGLSRHKFPTTTTTEDGAVNDEQSNAIVSPVSSPVARGLSPTTPLMASMDGEVIHDDEGMFLLEDMEVMGEDEFGFVGDDDDDDQLFAPLWNGDE